MGIPSAYTVPHTLYTFPTQSLIPPVLVLPEDDVGVATMVAIGAGTCSTGERKQGWGWAFKEACIFPHTRKNLPAVQHWPPGDLSRHSQHRRVEPGAGPGNVLSPTYSPHLVWLVAG